MRILFFIKSYSQYGRIQARNINYNLHKQHYLIKVQQASIVLKVCYYFITASIITLLLLLLLLILLLFL